MLAKGREVSKIWLSVIDKAKGKQNACLLIIQEGRGKI